MDRKQWGRGSGQSDYTFSAGSSQNLRGSHAQQRSDSYDFDISQDDYSFSSPEPTPKSSRASNLRGSYSSTSGGVGTGSVRRTSIEERAKEILEKARNSVKETPPVEAEPAVSLQDTFAELLKDVDIPSRRTVSEPVDILSPASQVTTPKHLTPGRGSQFGQPKRSTSDPFVESPSYGDSFELSAADFEVGAIAAKKMKEKHTERGRRLSFDQPNFKEQKELRRVSSPLQISSALSSIQHLPRSLSFGNDSDIRGFGSAGERSDDEIYKLLNVTGAQESQVGASRSSFLTGAQSGNSSFSAVPPKPQASAAPTQAARHPPSTSGEVSYSEDFIPETRSKPQTESAMDDDTYYEDDFETEPQAPSASLPPRPKLSAPSASAGVEMMLAPAASAASPVTTQQSGAKPPMTTLNSVEQIMQRWYDADASTLLRSLDDIGRSRSFSNNNAPSAGPDVPASPAIDAAPAAPAALPAPPSTDQKPSDPVSTAASRAQTPTVSAAQSPSPVSAETRPAVEATARSRTPSPAAQPLASTLQIPTWDFSPEMLESARAAVDDGEGEDRSESRGDGAVAESRDDDSFAGDKRSLDADGDLSRDEIDAEDDDVRGDSERERGVVNVPPADSAESSRSTGSHDDGDDLDLPHYRRQRQTAAQIDGRDALALVERSVVPTSSRGRAADPAEPVATRTPADSRAKGRLAKSTLARLNVKRQQQQEPAPSAAKRASARPQSATASAEQRRKPRSSRDSTPVLGDDDAPLRPRKIAAEPEGLRAASAASQRQYEMTLQSLAQSLVLPPPPPLADASLGLSATDVQREVLQRTQSLVRREQDVDARSRLLELRESGFQQRERLAQQQRSQDLEQHLLTIEQLQLENRALRDQGRALAAQCSQAEAAATAMRDEMDALKAERFMSHTSVGTGEVLPSQATAATCAAERRDALVAYTALLAVLQQQVTAQKQARRRRGAADSTQAAEPVVGEDTTISVPRKDFELLMRDYGAQETLLGGFQRENERFVERLRMREKELKSKEAAYFEEREQLLRQLNNGTAEAAARPNAVQAAQHLSAQLEADKKLLALRGAMAELQERLAQALRELVQSKDAHRAEREDWERRDNPRRLQQLQTQVAELREQLQAKQQQLVEVQRHARNLQELEAQLAQSQGQLQSLMLALAQRGVSPKLLQQLAQGQGRQLSEADDAHLTRVAQQQALVPQRHFQDIQKIKELEETVVQLQKALQQRFPDSVAGLLAAAKTPESGRLAQQVQSLKLQVEQLQSQGELQQQTYERALQELRAQHSQLQSRYGTLRKELSEQRVAPLSAARDDGEDAEHPRSGADFELEKERVRQFYLRKLREQEARFRQQLRLYQRGEAEEADLSGDSDPRSHSDSSRDDSASPVPVSQQQPQPQHLSEEVQAAHRSELQRLQEQLTTQQTQWVRAVEDAAQRRAEAESQQRQLQEQVQRLQQQLQTQTPQSLAAETVESSAVHQQAEQTLRAELADLRRQLQQERASYLQTQPQPQAQLETQTQAQLETQRLHIAALSQEVLRLKTQLQSAPKDLTYEGVARQLLHLQEKFGSRERELSSLLETQRLRQTAERERLQLHYERLLAQREDDLRRLQADMQQLVRELQSSQSAMHALPVPVAAPAPLPARKGVAANAMRRQHPPGRDSPSSDLHSIGEVSVH